MEVAAGVINSNNYMVTHSFFKNGETIQDGFDDKIYIHVDFNFKSDVKVLGCSWNGQCWYSLKNNHCYMDGSLPPYLYFVLLSGIEFAQNNNLLPEHCIKWNFKHKCHCVFFQNSFLQNGSLDKFNPTKNGEWHY